MMESNLPPDPFKAESSDDLAKFASNCYAMHTAFMAAGFSDIQALRITIELIASMMALQAKPKD